MIIPRQDSIASLIYFVRGEKIILDSDLAALYGVETRVLNQAVKRNRQRFPKDFMFKLKVKEFSLLRATYLDVSENSSQIVMSSQKHRGTSYLPLAFTEQGVAMLSGVLKSKRAIEVNISIMRTFVNIRSLIQGNKALKQKIKELEVLMNEKISAHDKKFQMVFEAIRQLIHEKNEPRNPIGYVVEKRK